jgi:hypothetical protein
MSEDIHFVEDLEQRANKEDDYTTLAVGEEDDGDSQW